MATVRIQGADTTANTGGYAEVLLVSEYPSRLFSVTGYNKSGSTVYIQIFNSAEVVAAGAWSPAPRILIAVPTASHFSVDFTDGRLFSSGIYIAASTSNTDYTAVGGNEVIIDATYRRNL
jgi:hypothetical protein